MSVKGSLRGLTVDKRVRALLTIGFGKAGVRTGISLHNGVAFASLARSSSLRVCTPKLPEMCCMCQIPIYYYASPLRIGVSGSPFLASSPSSWAAFASISASGARAFPRMRQDQEQSHRRRSTRPELNEVFSLSKIPSGWLK